MVGVLAVSSHLTVVGRMFGEDGTVWDVRVIVTADIRRSGRGAITFVWADEDLAIDGADLAWVVTTNKGWAHLRGVASVVQDERRLPFRADLFSSLRAGELSPDRIALRLYDVDGDPNLSSPIRKVQAWMEPGSVRF